MSVSQVKKRFSEFESFLKKDKEGLRRLKLLKDDVNFLRTSLAAAEEAEKLAIAVKDAARDRADKAESEASDLKLEIERLKQKKHAVELENDTLREKLESITKKERVPFASGDLVNDLSPGRIQRWAYKTLKEQGGTLKKPTRCTTPYPRGFNLEDILTGFDEFVFATLGRTIVLQLLVTEAVCVFWTDDDDAVDPDKILKAIWEQNDADKAKLTMQKLFLHQFDRRSDAEILKEKTSGKCPWADYGDTDSLAIIFGT